MSAAARGRARGSTEEVPAGRSTSRCSSRGLHVDRLVLAPSCLRRAHVDADPAAGAVVGSDLDRQPRARQLLASWKALDRNPSGAPATARRVEHLHADRRRAGRRWRTCRSRCRSRGPRPGSRGRWRASRTGRSRWGTCRRRGSALTGSRSPSPATPAVTRWTNRGRRRARAARSAGALVASRRDVDLVQRGRGQRRSPRSCARRRRAPLAVGLLDRALMRRDRLVAGQHPRGRRSTAASRC